MHIESRKIV